MYLMDPLGGSFTETRMDPRSHRVVILTRKTNPTLSLVVLQSSLNCSLVLDHVRIFVISQVIPVIIITSSSLNITVSDLSGLGSVILLSNVLVGKSSSTSLVILIGLGITGTRTPLLVSITILSIIISRISNFFYFFIPILNKCVTNTIQIITNLGTRKMTKN